MPINFTPYTQPVAPQNWNTPLEPSIYAQGVSNQAKRLENQSLIDSNSAENILGITAIAPQDEEQLQKIQQAFKEDVSKLNMSDLKNPQTKQQLDQQIAKYQDLLLSSGIPQRSAAVQKELATKKEIEAKGEKYTSPLLNQAEDYIQNGEFYKDTRFNRSGWITPNEAKMMKSAKEIAEKKKGSVENPDGTREEYEYYDPADLKAALMRVYKSDPNYEKEIGYQFEQQTKDINWDDYSKEEHATLVQEAENAIQLANTIINNKNSTKEDRLKAIAHKQKAEQIQSTYYDNYENPSSSEEMKQKYYNDFKNRQLQMSISAMDAEQRKPIAMNEIKKAQMELSNDLYKIRETELFKLETDSGLSRKNYTSEADFIKDAAMAVQKNKVKTAEAANPSLSTRSENYIDYIREGAIKDGAEKKAIESNISKNIDYFKNVGFTNIKGIESVKMDENGDFIIDFNREKFNPINLPIGIVNNNIGDEVKLTKDEMARIMEVGSGKRKLEDLNTITPNTTESQKPNTLSPISGFETTQYTVGNDTVTAPVITNLSDTTKLDRGAYFSYNGKLYTNE